jgi:hypothetical protein
MAEENWVSVATYPDRPSAEAILEILGKEDVAGYIASNDYIPGLGSNFSVLVPPQLEDKSRRLLEHSAVSESELTFLATGQRPDQK